MDNSLETGKIESRNASSGDTVVTHRKGEMKA